MNPVELADASQTAAHAHDGGLGDLLERVLHAGTAAGPLLVITLVMLLANRRANQRRRAG